MSINYALFENNLTTDPNDYAAMVQITGSVNLEEIAQRMIDQGSTTTKADILAVLEDTMKACEAYLLEGNRVQLGGLCELFPRVKGVFNGSTDTFDSSRHRVDVGANPGFRVRKRIRDDASVEKQEAVKPAPAPLEYVDLASGESNNTVTPGTIGTINGHRLKFDAGAADEGIYFVSEADPIQKVTAIQKNKPGQLVFLVPSAVTGDTLHIEVRSRIGNETGEVRVGRLDAVLDAS